MIKKKIILPTLRYKNSPELDSTIRVEFNNEKSLLRNDDRDIELDLSQQFETERFECNRYKIYGKIKMIFKNLYCGSAIYDYLKQRLYLIGDGSDGNFNGYMPYNEYGFIRSDIHKEISENVSVASMFDFTGFTITTTGNTEHQEITNLSSSSHNWNLYLSYVSSHDDIYPMKYTLTGSTEISFLSGDGIPFRVEETTSKYILTSPIKHGISQGEYIIINNIPYYVNSVGNEIFNSEKYVINISKTQLSGTTFNSLIIGKRCTDITNITNTTSQYYVHKHTILKTPEKFTIDKLGFESPIWEDERKLVFENSVGDNDVLVEKNRMESLLFDLTEPFILSGITNNLEYTPTDIYVSVIFKNGNGYFNYPPKIGYSFHFHNEWIDNHFDGSTSLETGLTYTNFIRESFTFSSGNTLNVGDEIYGAFVEYHPKEMKERIISESFHKIIINPFIFNHGQTNPNEYNGASDSNPIGLYYQPHYRFKLRELSPYTEISKSEKIDNLPENARYFEDEELWRWRDLYDIGYIDVDGNGVDYTYLNNMHYIRKDINFYLRNEELYLNKQDGIIDFYKNRKLDIC